MMDQKMYSKDTLDILIRFSSHNNLFTQSCVYFCLLWSVGLPDFVYLPTVWLFQCKLFYCLPVIMWRVIYGHDLNPFGSFHTFKVLLHWTHFFSLFTSAIFAISYNFNLYYYLQFWRKICMLNKTFYLVKTEFQEGLL